DEGVLWAGPVLLRFVGFLEALTERRFMRDVPARLHTRDGRDSTLVLALVPAPQLRAVPKLIPSRLTNAPPPPLYLRDLETPYWLEALNDTALYVQFNAVQDAGTATLAQFSRRLGT